MTALVAAFQFLTRWWIGMRLEVDSDDLRRSVLWYPLVGLTVSGVCLIVYRWVFAPLWPRPIARGMTLLLLVGSKDAFHLDGLSDLTDGLYGGRTPERVHEIMKDPAVGAMGLQAIVLALGVQAAVFWQLPSPAFGPAFATATTLATASGALLLCWNEPMLGRDGLAASISRDTPGWYAVLIETQCGAVAFLLLGAGGILVWGVQMVITVAVSLGFRRRLRGVNGDCCGATIVFVQTVLLLVVLGGSTAGDPLIPPLGFPR